MPVARRAWAVTFAVGLKGAEEAPDKHTVGDPNPYPSRVQQDAAVEASHQLDSVARKAAFERRVSTSGALHDYLTRRFACRAGELLILDPHLLGGDGQRVVNFLAGFDRPIRALRPSPRGPRGP